MEVAETHKSDQRVESGYTLVEMLLAVAISGILLGGVAGTIKVYQDQLRSNQAVWTGEQSVYFGMELMIRELREARSIVVAECDSARLQFEDFNAETVIYRLQDGTLQRQSGDETVAVVAGALDTESVDGSCFTLLGDPVDGIVIRLQGMVGVREVTVENAVTPRNL